MTARTLRLRVPGTPKSKGSVTRMPSGAMLQGKTAGQRDAYASWAVTVRTLAALEWGEQTHMAGPVALEVVFLLPRPKSRWRDEWHVSMPDLDKLVRTIGDELVGANVLADDRIIAELAARKFYCGPTGWTGADIIVRELTT